MSEANTLWLLLAAATAVGWVAGYGQGWDRGVKDGIKAEGVRAVAEREAQNGENLSVAVER